MSAKHESAERANIAAMVLLLVFVVSAFAVAASDGWRTAVLAGLAAAAVAATRVRYSAYAACAVMLAVAAFSAVQA